MLIVYWLVGLYVLGIAAALWRICRLHIEFGLPLRWLYFSLFWPVQNLVLPYLVMQSQNRPIPLSRQTIPATQTFKPWVLISFPTNLSEAVSDLKLLYWLDEDDPHSYWFTSGNIKQFNSRHYINIPISYNERKDWARLNYDTRKEFWELSDLKAPMLLRNLHSKGWVVKLSDPRIPVKNGTRWILHNSEMQLFHLETMYAIDSNGFVQTILLGKPSVLEFDKKGRWWKYHNENNPLIEPRNYRLRLNSDLRINVQGLLESGASFETPWASDNSIQPHLIPGAILHLKSGLSIRFSRSSPLEST